MTHQPDPLDDRLRQELAVERGAEQPLSVADLSDVEAEALLLLREHEPRLFSELVSEFGSPDLKISIQSARVGLWMHGLIRRSVLPDFLLLTADGARLQAELLRRGE